jgi:hypothetical protein
MFIHRTNTWNTLERAGAETAGVQAKRLLGINPA